MRYILSPVLVLILVCAISAQSKPNSSIEQELRSSGAKAVVVFDANSKVTTIRAVAENFAESDTKRAGVRAMNFAVGTLYAGEKIDRPVDPLTFSIWVMSGGKPRFGEDHSLVTVAGDRTDLGIARYIARRDGMEYLNFSLSRDQIAKLAEASIWMIGGKEFSPAPSQKKLLRDVLAATYIN